MSKKVKKDQADTSFEGIEHVLTKSERFIEENQKKLTQVVLGIVIAILLVVGVKRLYINPLSDDAVRDMFMAERFFERDSFNLALEGFGTYPGFLQVIEDYNFTKSAKLARYYAGVSFLNLGDYESAVHHLKKFSTKDVLVGSAWCSSLGDAYSELEEYSQAVKYYIRGAEKFENKFSTPILLKKAGLVYEEMKDFNKALEVYNRIKRNYPDSPEGRDITKYIARAEVLAKQ